MVKATNDIYNVQVTMRPRSTGQKVPGSRNDDEPPHIHLQYDDVMVKLFLEEWECDTTDIPENIKRAIEDLYEYREQLIEMFNTQKFKKIKLPGKKKRSNKNIVNIQK